MTSLSELHVSEPTGILVKYDATFMCTCTMLVSCHPPKVGRGLTWSDCEIEGVEVHEWREERSRVDDVGVKGEVFAMFAAGLVEVLPAFRDVYALVLYKGLWISEPDC